MVFRADHTSFSDDARAASDVQLRPHWQGVYGLEITRSPPSRDLNVDIRCGMNPPEFWVLRDALSVWGS